MVCTAAWMAGICAFLPQVLTQDRRWGRASLRQRLVAALAQFELLGDETNLYPAIAETSRSLYHTLRQRWSAEACELPLYQAFADADTFA